MTKKLLVFLVCFALAGFPMLTFAEGQADAENDGPDLSNWSNKSSLSYSPMVKNFLVHANFTYNFTKNHGNAEGEEYDGLFLFSMRKYRFTYYGFLELSKQDLIITVNNSMMLTENSWYDNILRTD
ncbi:MAG: hypothetical protein P9M15_02725, partial [Candidatus Electryoneaceae bacterium]|nr:hypothetical protein [Candidatus Electryoneaceae bacterium]